MLNNIRIKAEDAKKTGVYAKSPILSHFGNGKKEYSESPAAPGVLLEYSWSTNSALTCSWSMDEFQIAIDEVKIGVSDTISART